MRIFYGSKHNDKEELAQNNMFFKWYPMNFQLQYNLFAWNIEINFAVNCRTINASPLTVPWRLQVWELMKIDANLDDNANRTGIVSSWEGSGVGRLL